MPKGEFINNFQMKYYSLDDFCILQSHNKLVELLDSADIERATESFSWDPKPALTNLKVF